MERGAHQCGRRALNQLRVENANKNKQRLSARCSIYVPICTYNMFQVAYRCSYHVMVMTSPEYISTSCSSINLPYRTDTHTHTNSTLLYVLFRMSIADRRGKARVQWTRHNTSYALHFCYSRISSISHREKSLSFISFAPQRLVHALASLSGLIDPRRLHHFTSLLLLLLLLLTFFPCSLCGGVEPISRIFCVRNHGNDIFCVVRLYAFVHHPFLYVYRCIHKRFHSPAAATVHRYQRAPRLYGLWVCDVNCIGIQR